MYFQEDSIKKISSNSEKVTAEFTNFWFIHFISYGLTIRIYFPLLLTIFVNAILQHSGKARKGDGNDLTPNPRKLYSIGKELDKLGRTINDMTPVSELPFNVRPKSRKEKNKLASRACRLKKKAQHEANKIKLYGLEAEHSKCGDTISHDFDMHFSYLISVCFIM